MDYYDDPPGACRDCTRWIALCDSREAQIVALKRDLANARADARSLLHAYERDTRPARDVIKRVSSYPKETPGG